MMKENNKKDQSADWISFAFNVTIVTLLKLFLIKLTVFRLKGSVLIVL
jgi:hypothetical protein